MRRIAYSYIYYNIIKGKPHHVKKNIGYRAFDQIKVISEYVNKNQSCLVICSNSLK